MRTTPIIFAMIALAACWCSADDLKTVDGKEYKGVTISRVEPDGVVVVTDSGIEKIPFSNLPVDVQKKYGYNPAKAAQFQQAVNEAQQQRADHMKSIEQSEHDAAASAQASSEVEKTKVGKTGNVVQVFSYGLLIQELYPVDQMFFVYCEPGDKADGDLWSGKVYPVGNYAYTSTLGAHLTVHAFAATPELALKALAPQK